MSLTLDTNHAALDAALATFITNRSMETSIEHLSTGKRIKSASDDAAGVAIASRLTAEIMGANQSTRNALDGQALINTGEGAHKETASILQRGEKFLCNRLMAQIVCKIEQTFRLKWMH